MDTLYACVKNVMDNIKKSTFAMPELSNIAEKQRNDHDKD